MHPDYQGKGYMQEAITLVIRFAFDRIGLSVLGAYSHKDNSASTKLLPKNGFELETGKNDPDNENTLIYFLRHQCI